METFFAENFDQHGGTSTVSLRCPACRQQGTFERINSHDERIWKGPGRPQDNRLTGQRRCPNPKCRAHIFTVMDGTGHLLVSYPPERFDFDASNVPDKIKKSFEEAIACQAAGAHVAAAIMIRKTLENLCEDRQAAGKDLQQRIKSLGNKIVLPTELLQAIDDLRLLGNDAAHVEAKTYDDVGPDEIDAAFVLTKEILKATYQYSTLLAKLQGLKKPKAIS